jgi:hypothetical protein
MRSPKTLLLYLQQIRPLSECDAEDGRIVGQLLLDLVEEKPKDLAHAIRMFVNRTAMLRECSFRHISAILARLLNSPSGSDNGATIVVLSPSAVTEKQAIAIGSAIVSSMRQSPVPAAALKQVVQSHAVLRAMSSGYVWFVPMLEVITAHTAAALRRSSWMKRSSSIVAAELPSMIGPSDETLDADGAEGESSFSSVVRLAARRTLCCFAHTLPAAPCN